MGPSAAAMLHADGGQQANSTKSQGLSWCRLMWAHAIMSWGGVGSCQHELQGTGLMWAHAIKAGKGCTGLLHVHATSSRTPLWTCSACSQPWPNSKRMLAAIKKVAERLTLMWACSAAGLPA